MASKKPQRPCGSVPSGAEKRKRRKEQAAKETDLLSKTRKIYSFLTPKLNPPESSNIETNDTNHSTPTVSAASASSNTSILDGESSGQHSSTREDKSSRDQGKKILSLFILFQLISCFE